MDEAQEGFMRKHQMFILFDDSIQLDDSVQVGDSIQFNQSVQFNVSVQFDGSAALGAQPGHEKRPQLAPQRPGLRTRRIELNHRIELNGWIELNRRFEFNRRIRRSMNSSGLRPIGVVDLSSDLFV